MAGVLDESSCPICRTVNAAATVGKTLAGCSASIKAACPQQTMRPNVTGECMTVMQVRQAALSPVTFVLTSVNYLSIFLRNSKTRPRNVSTKTVT